MKLSDFDIKKFGDSIQISGVILTDYENDKVYITPLPEEEISDKTMDVLYMDDDDWIKFFRQTDLQEIEVDGQVNGKFKKIILRKTARQIDQGVSWRVFKRDHYTCRYCGKDDLPLTVDHLVLWKNGGPSIEENLVASCKKCNKLRGDMEYEDWINSDKYLELSVNLEPVVKILNKAITHTLEDIPIRLHIPSRGKKKKKRNRN